MRRESSHQVLQEKGYLLCGNGEREYIEGLRAVSANS